LKIELRVSTEELAMPLVSDATESHKLAKAIRRRADGLPPGPEKEQLLSQAHDADADARSDRWRTSTLNAPD
jgi:hypothetical protein